MDIIDVLQHLKLDAKNEFLNIQNYWSRFSVDEKFGGFYGRINNHNLPIENSDKGIILNSRILWTFSAAFKHYSTKESAYLAQRAYKYLIDYFIDREYGGVFWTVDKNGNALNSTKYVYAQAFAVYGLSEYYSAFDVKNAEKYATQLYDLIENYCTDDMYGGYYEAYSRDWKLKDDVRMSSKDLNVPKSMNTHLHLIEAYSNLYRYSPNRYLKKALVTLLDIFYLNIFNSNKNSLVSFFDNNWSVKSGLISPGHDIEASWLCYEAANLLEDNRLISIYSNLTSKISDNVIKIADSDGGIVNELSGSSILDSNKDWWPQAEAIIGHLNTFQISGEIKYLNAALESWKFIKKYIIDKKNGEWFEKVNREGKPYSSMDKIRQWKAPYHNGRAMLEISSRVDKLVENITKDLSIEKIDNQ
ncbi:MAG: N-acyl-D-glucosamine 2-epimerase [Balneola sp.]|nr:N-acyl-D-glucosamine 2-epimerase [Balneola sp.]|tara:strand:- start:342 stop:1589 length:1248 start_codon:yes stop_codon:yes gene_type:complete